MYKLACLNFFGFLFTAVSGRSRQIRRVDGKGKDGEGWMHHRPPKQLLISHVQLRTLIATLLASRKCKCHTTAEYTITKNAPTSSAGHP